MTLKTDNLQNSTATKIADIGNIIDGSAKVWVNYNGTASTIRKSFNISSVTKNGTGDYTINFTNALPDVNYSVTGMSFGSQGLLGINSGGSPSTTSTRFVSSNSGTGSGQDSTYVLVSIFD